jgi:hypothetical protein
MLVAGFVSISNGFAWLTKQLSSWKVVFLVVLAVVVNLLVTALFSFVLFPGHKAGLAMEQDIYYFLTIIILAPFLETLLVQRGIINYILKKWPTELLMACLISSLVFAAFHHYSIPYIIKTFFSGFIYGTLYISVKQKNENAFLATLIAHAVFNGLGFFITLLLRS